MIKQSYFKSRPDIVKLFDDLEDYRLFCVFEMIRFDESALYNRKDRNWRYYESRTGNTAPKRNFKSYKKRNR